MHYIKFVFAALLTTLTTQLCSNHKLLDYYNGKIELTEEERLYLVNHTIRTKPSNYLVAYAYYLRGVIYKNDNRIVSAFDSYYSSFEYLSISDTIDSFLHSAILRNLGMILFNCEFYQEAIYLHDKALLPAYEFSQTQGLSVKHNIGRIYTKIDFEKALNIYSDALKEAEHENLLNRQAQIFISIGIIHLENKVFEKAIDFFNKAIKATSVSEIKARAYHNISEAYFRQNNFKEQEKYLKKSLEYLSNNKRFYGLLDLGECYIKQGKLEQGKLFLQEAEKYYSNQSLMAMNIKVFERLELVSEMPLKYDYAKIQLNEQIQLKKVQVELANRINKLKNEQLSGSTLLVESKTVEVIFYKKLTIISIGSALFILLVWRIWWYLLRRRISAEVNAVIGNVQKKD